ncbi:hypothetical protein LK09_19235 [Microbacterium mangrovi]|uniref:Uncharacterized protein n=1 Tax=Microbacterium mangrovi TaxID=1348253 RepID=A0A0B2A1T3_9MICO|nr:hypothetical protein LK09_19235 [Microbacterium mangrovi]
MRRANRRARAYLCDGDPTSAVVWDPESEITIRLSLRGDEIWVIAGSGILIRFVADSGGELDHEGIAIVLTRILAGEAVEHFGVAGQDDGDAFATGYRVGTEGFSGGFTAEEAKFRARLAGPLAVATLELPE